MGSKLSVCSCSKASLEGGWGTVGSLMLFILCSVHFSPAPALTATSLLLSILSLVVTMPLMFAQQLCTYLPVGRAETPFVRAFLWGLRKWFDALLWPLLTAGLLHSHWCPLLRLRWAPEENFPQNILTWEKPLWEQSPQLPLPLQMWVHFPLLGNEWELFQGTKFQQEPWRLSWDQYCLDLALCRVQMVKSQSGTNPVSPPWDKLPPAFGHQKH